MKKIKTVLNLAILMFFIGLMCVGLGWEWRDENSQICAMGDCYNPIIQPLNVPLLIVGVIMVGIGMFVIIDYLLYRVWSQDIEKKERKTDPDTLELIEKMRKKYFKKEEAKKE